MNNGSGQIQASISLSTEDLKRGVAESKELLAGLPRAMQEQAQRVEAFHEKMVQGAANAGKSLREFTLDFMQNQREMGNETRRLSAEVDKAASSMAASVKRATATQQRALAEMRAGSKDGPEFYDELGKIRGIDPAKVEQIVAPLRQVRSEIEATIAKEKEFAAITAFDKKHQDAKKFVQDAEYVRFWTNELTKAEAAEREFAATMAFEKKHQDAKRLVQDAEYVRFWATELEKVDAAEAKLAANNSFVDKLRKESEAIGKTRADLLEMQAAQMGLTKETAPYIAKLREQESALKTSGKVLNEYGMSAKQTAAALRQVPAQFTDIVVSLQGGQAPLTVLLQQGGQLKDVFGGAGIAARALGSYIITLLTPVNAAIAVFAGLAYALYKTNESYEAFNATLISSGNQIGMTADDLVVMSEEIGNFNDSISQSEAMDVMKSIASSGIVAKDSLKQLTEEAIKFEKFGGASAKEVIKSYEELATKPFEAVLGVQKAFGFLTVEQAKAVAQFKELGKEAEASKLLTEAFIDSISKRTPELNDNLSSTARMWIRIKDGISDTTEKLVQYLEKATGSGTKQNQLDKARRDLESMKNEGFSEVVLSNQRVFIANLEAEIEAKKRLAKANGDAAASVKPLLEAMNKQKKISDDGIQNQIANLKARIQAENEYLGRLVIQGDTADKLTEGEKEVLKIQEMILKSKNDQEKAALRIAEAQAKELARVQGLILERKNAMDLGEDQRKKALQEANKDIDAFNQSMRDIDIAKLSSMFNGAIDGALKFAVALNSVVQTQESLEKALAGNKIKYAGDQSKMASEEAAMIAKAEIKTIESYKNMAAGLKTYAKEGSKAYDALHNAERAFRAFEIASAVEAMAKKSGLLDAFTLKKINSDIMSMASGVANVAKETAAFFGLGQTKAAVAVANQGAQGDFVTAFPRMATVAAMMAGLGFLTGAIGGGSGGGGMPTNEGKGTTFGDAGKASESLSNSLDILNSTQDIALNYTREMAMSLRSIDSSMAGLTNLYLRSTGMSDLTSSIQTGRFDTALSSTVAAVTNFVIGVMNPAIAAVDFALGGVVTNTVNSISRALFGSKVSVTGSGISSNSQLLGDIANQGFQGNYYADVQTKKKLFGFTTSTSTSTQYSQLDSELKQQFTAIFRSVGNAVSSAADLLQIESESTQKRLQQYVVNLGRIDLKGLSGDAIAEKLANVFGAESDKIASAIIPGFEKIQKVGEGYFETLSRVAIQFELVRVYTERLGDSMQLVGVQGGLLADSIIEVFGGISEYQSSVQQYYEDFFTAEERGANAIIEMTRAMSYMGESVPETTQGFKDLVNAQDLTTESGRKAYATLISLSPAFAEMIQAAEDLKSGYRDAVFTSAEMLAFNEQTVRDQFRNLGVAGGDVPESIAEFRALVDAQNESTDAGKKLKFALMALAPAFVDVVTAQEEARQEILDAEKAAQDKIASERQSLEKQLLTATGNTAEIRRLELESLDSSNRALQERIWALEDEKKAQQELAAASSGVVSEIDRLKKSLSGSTEAQSAAALQAQFATTTAQARSGDLTALSKLPTISSALDQAFQLTATTASEVARMKGFLAGSLAETLSVLGAGSAEKAISTISSVDLTAKTETDGLELTPTSTTAGLMSGASSTAVLIEEISALRVDNQAQARAIVQLQSRLTKVVERWDIDGIPETRAVV